MTLVVLHGCARGKSALGDSRVNAVVLGFALDLALGDQRRLHPVAGFGKVADELETAFWRPSRVAGVIHTVSLVAGVGASVGLVDRRLGGWRRSAFASLVLWTTLGGRSLRVVALKLARALENGDLEDARRIVPSSEQNA